MSSKRAAASYTLIGTAQLNDIDRSQAPQRH